MNDTVSPVIPEKVAQALGNLPRVLSAHGYVPLEVQTSSSFGDFAVTYVSPSGTIQVARGRGQFIVSGPQKAELESAGLWRAFAGANDLEPLLKAWLSTANEA